MKTLLITAFAAVFALQVQGQKILQEYIDHTPELYMHSLEPSNDNAQLESISNATMITTFTHNDAGERTGYIYKNKSTGIIAANAVYTASDSKKTEYLINYAAKDTTTSTNYYDAQARIYRTDVAINEKFTKSTSTTITTFGLDGRVESKITNSNGSYDTGYLWSKKDSTVNTYDSRNRIVKSLTIHIKNDNFVEGTVTTRDSIIYSYDELDRLSMYIVHQDKTSSTNAFTYTTIYTYTVDESDPNVTVRNFTKQYSDTTCQKYRIGINKQGQVIYYIYAYYQNNVEINRGHHQYKYNSDNKLTESIFTASYNNSQGVMTVGYTWVNRYEYNQVGDIVRHSSGRTDLTTGNYVETGASIYTYLQAPKATGVAIYSNQKIAVTFNYELDPATANVKEMLQLTNNSSGLTISNAYVNAENNSQLIIELNRQVVKDESFDIATSTKLPLKYGRTVALEVKVDGQTPTADGAVRPSQIVVSQTSAGISISAGAEIVSVKVFTASGVLAQSLQPASTEASISAQSLPAGVYQVLVTDADGTTASQTVSF